MVLTDRQRSDLHAGIYEYLLAQAAAIATHEAGDSSSTSTSEAFAKAAEALHACDPAACSSIPPPRLTPSKNNDSSSSSNSNGNGSTSTTIRNGTTTNHHTSTTTTPLLEKKWVAIPRLQKKVMELERIVAQSAKIHSHRFGGNASNGSTTTGSALASSSSSSNRRFLPRQPYLHKLQGHIAVVTCVAIHPVFTLCTSGSEDGTIKIWDHESGEFVKTLKGHTSAVNGLDFTPRGTHLASCSSDLSIKLWLFTTDNSNAIHSSNSGGSSQPSQSPLQYTCIRTLRGHDHTISAVRFVPHLLSLSVSPIHTTTTTTTTPTRLLSSSAGSHGSTTSRVFQVSAAGCQVLLSASRDTTVKLWDLETGFCEHTVSQHQDWVRCLAVQTVSAAAAISSSSIDSNSHHHHHHRDVLWASSGNDTDIYVYEGRKVVAELRGHEHVVESLAFVCEDPDPAAKKGASNGSLSLSTSKNLETVRDYLASGSRDRTVKLWTIRGATCLATFVAHENWVRSVLIHPSGQYIISCADDKTIRVFDIAGQRCLRVLDQAHEHFVTSLAMHYTLPILASGSVDRTIRCWQLD